MKKFLLMVCSAALLLSLVGCGDAASKKSSSDDVKEENPSVSQSENVSDNQTESTANSQPEEESKPNVEVPPVVEWKPEFESKYLELYADQFHNDEIKKIYAGENGGLYVETAENFFDAEDSKKVMWFDESVMASWSYSQYTGFIYTDHEGNYYFEEGVEYITNNIKGDIFYCFVDVMSYDLFVYSLDDQGYIYCNRIDHKTGEKEQDNERIVFDVYGYKSYDRVDSLRVLPKRAGLGAAPYVLVYLDGYGYVKQLSNISHNSVNLSDKCDLDTNKTYMGHGIQNVDYVTEGINDKISYLYNNREYVVDLPDGHTVDQIKYFNRGVGGSPYGTISMEKYDMLVFDNGDVYLWNDADLTPNEQPIKNEELSQIGAEIEEVIFSGDYYFLMSDGAIYRVDENVIF